MTNRVAAVLFIALAASGCITIDATVERDGSATFRAVYQTGSGATEFLEKRRFASAHVTVDSAKIEEDGTTTIVGHVDDVANVASAKIFRNVDVRRRHTRGADVLTIVITNPTPGTIADRRRPGPTIRITLPGRVLRANEHATVDGNTVAWSFTLADFLPRRSIELTVSYAGPADS